MRTPSRYLGIAAIGAVVLGGLFTWFLGNFLYSLLWGFLDQWHVREADLIAYTLAHLTPFILAIVVIAIVYLAFRWEFRRGGGNKAVAPPTEPTITAAVPSSPPINYDELPESLRTAAHPDLLSPIRAAVGSSPSVPAPSWSRILRDNRVRVGAVVFIVAVLIVVWGIPHWFGDYELTEKNANIAIQRVVPVEPRSKSDRLMYHIFYRNIGSIEAISQTNTDTTYVASPAGLAPDIIDEQFAKLHASMKKSNETIILQPNEEGYITYVLPFNGDSYRGEVLDGVHRLYIYFSVIYRDRLIPRQGFIFTDFCFWVMATGALQRCPRHNGRVLE